MAPVYGLAERAAEIIQADYAATPSTSVTNTTPNNSPSPSPSSSANSSYRNNKFGYTWMVGFVCFVLTLLL